MKRFVPFIALLALVALVGCSADSPSAKPVPTVVPESWGISSLTASDTGPYVGTVILVEAAVTKNGAAAPDTETVTFQATGGAFSSGSTEASVNVSGGTASVAYFSDVAGTFEVRALFKGVSSVITITYRDRAVTDELQLFDVNPRRGSYAGGEEVLITGKGILAPVEVYFDVAGVAYQAIVAAVSESRPPSDPGSVTVVTPNFTGADTSIEQAADVRVIVGAGTGSAQSDTLTSAYVLLPSLGGSDDLWGLPELRTLLGWRGGQRPRPGLWIGCLGPRGDLCRSERRCQGRHDPLGLPGRIADPGRDTALQHDSVGERRAL
jgi:hypothetical protein